METWLFQFLRTVGETALWVVTIGVGSLVHGIIEHPQGVLLGFAVGIPAAIMKSLKS